MSLWYAFFPFKIKMTPKNTNHTYFLEEIKDFQQIDKAENFQDNH